MVTIFIIQVATKLARFGKEIRETSECCTLGRLTKLCHVVVREFQRCGRTIDLISEGR